VWPWLISLTLIAALIAAFVVPMPYYVDGPGVVRATQPLVSVSGHTAYDSSGVVMFTTVSQRPATPFLLLKSWLDDAIDTLPEEQVTPPGSNRETQRREEQAQMDRSKLTALEVAFAELDLPLTITGTGAFINEVSDQFPAATVIGAGDVITAIDGTPVTIDDDVRPLLAVKAVGDEVTLSVRKKGGTAVADEVVELGRNPDDPSHGYLGVSLSTADEKVDMPFDVELDSGSVIGPSAGLAWTLGVIDRLSPGDLTHGRKVAVTGTIAEDGTVGPIGGIAQKVVAAKDAGATMFIYPASTAPEDVKRMTSLADGDITLRPVATIDDALKVLDPSGLGAE
jgi:PDZ domain-containing protein